jgi:hypothetical protein
LAFPNVALYQNFYFLTYFQTEKETFLLSKHKKFEDPQKLNSDDGIENRVSNQCCDKSFSVLNKGKNFVQNLEKFEHCGTRQDKKMRG